MGRFLVDVRFPPHVSGEVCMKTERTQQFKRCACAPDTFDTFENSSRTSANVTPDALNTARCAANGRNIQVVLGFFFFFLYLHEGEYAISAVSGHYHGTSQGFWQAHYSTSPHPHSAPTCPNISSHLPDQHVSSRHPQPPKRWSRKRTRDKFPVLDEGKAESASIGADVGGGVLQGKPAVTGLMCSCQCVVT